MRLLRSLREGYLLDTGTPWITFDAIDCIAATLPAHPAVFEYGSGGSTLFWLKHGARLVSVEHDPVWYADVRSRVDASAAFDYRLVLPVKSNGQGDVGNPAHYASSDPAFTGYSFREYVCQIDSFPDASFDVVLVDGRARPACIAHGARKVKRGGLLVLDNADRAYYTEQNSASLRHFVCHTFVGATPGLLWPSQTNCYVRGE
ncbi:MAG: hypothetical protein RLZZ387_2038 [Chloroflexota bacterium]